MVSLNFYQPKDLSELDFQLNEIQSHYSALPKSVLERIEERNQNDDFFAYPITVFDNETIVGFFVLDFGDDKFEFTADAYSVLLRSLSINPEFQGKGIGTSVMIAIDDFVKDHFHDCKEIVLSVNERNISALEIYLKTGYHLTGKIKEGRSGPQLVMAKILE